MLNSLMDNIIEVLNNSDDLEESIIQFLTATPFTKFDYHNMGRLINKKNFFEYFYCDSDEANKFVEYVIRTTKKFSATKNSIFLLGYMGCGKTTLTNYTIDKLQTNEGVLSNDIFLVDFDLYGEKKPSCAGFERSLIDDIRKNISTLFCFCDLFKRNISLIDKIDPKNELYNFYNEIKTNILPKINSSNHFRFEDGSDLKILNKLKDIVHTKVDIKGIFILTFFWVLSKEYNSERNNCRYLFFIFVSPPIIISLLR